VIAKDAANYKSPLNEHFIAHTHILDNYHIEDMVFEKMQSFIYDNLMTNWPEINRNEIEKIYPIRKNNLHIITQDYKHKSIGFCTVCNHNTIFYSNEDWLRDHYRCMICNSTPRERAIFNVLNKECYDWRNKNIHESSPSNNYFEICAKNYSKSQFYPENKLGSLINGVRNENLEQLTFNDNTFDIFISLDVLEHVFNPDLALKEMLRVTKPGGIVIFTTPIHKNFDKSIKRAELLSDGSVKEIFH
jgi:hypothetical protein